MSERTPLSPEDLSLAEAIQDGLPMVPRPYELIGHRLGLSEAEVIAGIRRLQAAGAIKRMGVVVRHRELGYRANAMVVWDVPDDQVSALGHCLGQFEFVTLCYRRPRRGAQWPYNLFCMIHGRDRVEVLGHLSLLISRCQLEGIPHTVLFSRRRFKQRGARYLYPDHAQAAADGVAAVA
jgi:DNA-binding Lrp family transcriptional regulator